MSRACGLRRQKVNDVQTGGIKQPLRRFLTLIALVLVLWTLWWCVDVLLNPAAVPASGSDSGRVWFARGVAAPAESSGLVIASIVQITWA